ncbi:hypothetical protein [Streptomyces sp. bgisy027]|uniref:hypothetical protein n=1 Tax=Streptomyces sp. bgisy027 TaxID=3413770 RepID=UPI003D709B8F
MSVMGQGAPQQPAVGPGEIGLGTVIRYLTARLHIPACSGCLMRAEALDRRVRFRIRSGRRFLRRSAAAGDCWYFQSRCTGFGSRQCVSGPARQEPDAEIIEQCCGGWFQYAWIEVCPGEQARSGCGFCFW